MGYGVVVGSIRLDVHGPVTPSRLLASPTPRPLRVSPVSSGWSNAPAKAFLARGLSAQMWQSRHPFEVGWGGT
jgi:hypothetical protein